MSDNTDRLKELLREAFEEIRMTPHKHLQQAGGHINEAYKEVQAHDEITGGAL